MKSRRVFDVYAYLYSHTRPTNQSSQISIAAKPSASRGESRDAGASANGLGLGVVSGAGSALQSSTAQHSSSRVQEEPEPRGQSKHMHVSMFLYCLLVHRLVAQPTHLADSALKIVHVAESLQLPFRVSIGHCRVDATLVSEMRKSMRSMSSDLHAVLICLRFSSNTSVDFFEKNKMNKIKKTRNTNTNKYAALCGRHASTRRHRRLGLRRVP
jgi:hypothetical protein